MGCAIKLCFNRIRLPLFIGGMWVNSDCLIPFFYILYVLVLFFCVLSIYYIYNVFLQTFQGRW